MDRGRLRVIVLGVATVAALVAGLFVLPWFRTRYGTGPGDGGGGPVTIDLRSVEACIDGRCSAGSIDEMRGLYPTLAHLTFWLGLATGAVVAVQVVLRIGGGAGSALVTKIGAWCAVALVLAVGATGFVFQPEHHAVGYLAYDISRGLGPIVMLGGVAGALATLLYATQHDLEGGAYTPVVVPPRKFKDPVRTNADTREISEAEVAAARDAPAKPAETTTTTTDATTPAETTTTKP